MSRLSRPSPWAWAVLFLTGLGFAIRFSNFDQGLFGDELSTAWIVRGQSLGHVLHWVRSDAEVTPPLSFVLSWAASKLGSNPDLLRLPSLVAGTALIPLVYAVGARAVSRTAGLIAAALVTISPFMIYYATEARGYALMMAFVVVSTLAMLIAVERGGRWWWALYGASSALAMYSHYTAAFPLIGQLAWVLWAHPQARWHALGANLVALVLYIPWIPGYIADQNSVTIPILNAFLPFTFHAARLAIENWAVGYPYVFVRALPGEVWAVAATTGALIALAFAVPRALAAVRERGLSWADALRTRASLLIVLALSAPVGEAIYSAIGSNVLGARNLNSSLPGLALCVGMLIAAVPIGVAAVAGVLVFAGIGVGAVKTTEARYARANDPAVASWIEARWRPDDVVADDSSLPVVPRTGLDNYLPQTHREVRFRVPKGDPPFTIASPVPSAERLERKAAALRHGARLFLVVSGDNADAAVQPENGGIPQAVTALLPANYRELDSFSVAGVQPLTVILYGPSN